MTRIAISSAISVVVLSLGLNGCDSAATSADAGGTPPADHRTEIPEAPAGAFQFVMPETVIPAGEERMVCWIPDWVPEQDYLVSQFVGLQGAFGHHVVALQSGVPRSAGDSFDCTNLESMVSLEPLILPDPENDKLLPDGFAVRLPEGARIVIQSHYVNVSSDDILVRDVAQLFLAENPETAIEASYFIANHGDIVLDADKEGTATLGCTLEEDLNLIVLLGHMHELGTSMRVERTRGETTDRIYGVDAWTVEYRDVPPLELYAPDAPLALAAGDTVSVTCEYNNRRDHQVFFPEEMCTVVGYYFPARPEGIVFCD